MQYLIVINIASVNLKIIKPKYPVACSRSVGAAGERDLLWSLLLLPRWGEISRGFYLSFFVQLGRSA